MHAILIFALLRLTSDWKLGSRSLNTNVDVPFDLCPHGERLHDHAGAFDSAQQRSNAIKGRLSA